MTKETTKARPTHRVYAVTKNGELWATDRQENKIIRVSRDLKKLGEIQLPVLTSGITVDAQGGIWLAAGMDGMIAKLDDAEITANRNGASNDPKADAAVKFAATVTRERGHVNDAALQSVRAAGYDDAQILEIVLHVALNTLTNYVNEVAKTDVDFPVVHARDAA